MRIRILSVILVVSVLVIVILLARFRTQLEPRLEHQRQVLREQQKTATAPSAGSAASAPVAAGTPPKTETDRDPEFKKWLDQEAARVDQVHVDHDATKAEYQRVVRNLTATQAEELSRTATDPKSSSGQKILSVYLLVEGGPKTRAALQNFITLPMEDFGPPNPHSEAEMRSSQARALKVMAIDGLVSQAAKDPTAEQSLSQALANISDPYIRKYAENRIRGNAH